MSSSECTTTCNTDTYTTTQVSSASNESATATFKATGSGPFHVCYNSRKSGWVQMPMFETLPNGTKVAATFFYTDYTSDIVDVTTSDGKQAWYTVHATDPKVVELPSSVQNFDLALRGNAYAGVNASNMTISVVGPMDTLKPQNATTSKLHLSGHALTANEETAAGIRFVRMGDGGLDEANVDLSNAINEANASYVVVANGVGNAAAARNVHLSPGIYAVLNTVDLDGTNQRTDAFTSQLKVVGPLGWKIDSVRNEEAKTNNGNNNRAGGKETIAATSDGLPQPGDTVAFIIKGLGVSSSDSFFFGAKDCATSATTGLPTGTPTPTVHSVGDKQNCAQLGKGNAGQGASLQAGQDPKLTGNHTVRDCWVAGEPADDLSTLCYSTNGTGYFPLLLFRIVNGEAVATDAEEFALLLAGAAGAGGGTDGAEKFWWAIFVGIFMYCLCLALALIFFCLRRRRRDMYLMTEDEVDKSHQCPMCHVSVPANKPYMELRGNWYHEECWNCTECGNPLKLEADVGDEPDQIFHPQCAPEDLVEEFDGGGDDSAEGTISVGPGSSGQSEEHPRPCLGNVRSRIK